MFVKGARAFAGVPEDEKRVYFSPGCGMLFSMFLKMLPGFAGPGIWSRACCQEGAVIKSGSIGDVWGKKCKG
jgi:hypothetical protein